MLDGKKEEKDNKSIEDIDREKLIEHGKRLLETIYEDEGMETFEVEEGRGYVFREKRPEEGLELALNKMKEEGKGYVLTSINPADIKKEYDVSDESISFYWLTVLEGNNNFDPTNLHLIGHSIIDFLENKKGLIFIEGIDKILNHNSFDRFWRCLNHLIDVVSEENGILVISLDPSTLSDQYLSKIKKKLEILR